MDIKVNIEKIKVFLFYATLFFLIMAVAIKYNMLDVDLWARLIMGMHVFQTGLPQYQDVISYTPTHTWYDPEWLSSAFIYFIQTKFGGTGLTVLKGVGLFLILVMISIAVKSRENKNNSPYNILYYVVLIAILTECSVTVLLRCQYITFFLMSLWILLLEKVRNGNNKPLYFMPFIMLFWLNTHGGCIAGVGILFLYGVGEFLNKKPFKKYFITLFFVCLMFFINPWGFEYIKFMIESSYLDRSWISEWQSQFTGQYAGKSFYKALLFISFASYIYKIWWKKITYNQLNKTKFLILVMIAFLSAMHIKHTAIFVVVYSIYMYDDYMLIFNHLMEKLRNYLQLDKTVMTYFGYVRDIIIYFTIYVYALVIFVTIPIKTSYYDSTLSNFPMYPLHFLELNQIKGKIFSGFFNGSFIGYKYYPDLKIYMDGREEQVYSSEMFDNQMFFLYWYGPHPESVIKKYPPDIIMIEIDWPSNNYLLSDESDYIRIYSDYGFNIYVKKGTEKFNYKYPTISTQYIMEHIFDTKHDYSKKKEKIKK